MGSLQSVGIDIDSIIECLCVRALQVLVQFDTCPVFCLFFLLVQAMEWDLLVLFWWLHGSFSLFWLSFYVGTRNCSYIFVYSLFFFWVCAWVWMCMHANMHCVLLCVYASSEISSTCRVLTHRASRTGTMFLFAYFFFSPGGCLSNPERTNAELSFPWHAHRVWHPICTDGHCGLSHTLFRSFVAFDCGQETGKQKVIKLVFLRRVSFVETYPSVH